MEAIFTTLTDEQRVSTLNSIYQKCLSTSKDNLAFSADKLVYIKPFVSKLQNDNGGTQDLSSRLMTRQVIDELLQDIFDEIQLTSTNNEASINKMALEYGFNMFVSNDRVEDFYYANKVA